jgi:hypothetical protein
MQCGQLALWWRVCTRSSTFLPIHSLESWSPSESKISTHSMNNGRSVNSRCSWSYYSKTVHYKFIFTHCWSDLRREWRPVVTAFVNCACWTRIQFFVYKYWYGVLNNIQRINIHFPHHSKRIISALQQSVSVFRENIDIMVKNIRNTNTLFGKMQSS